MDRDRSRSDRDRSRSDKDRSDRDRSRSDKDKSKSDKDRTRSDRDRRSDKDRSKSDRENRSDKDRGRSERESRSEKDRSSKDRSRSDKTSGGDQERNGRSSSRLEENKDKKGPKEDPIELDSSDDSDLVPGPSEINSKKDANKSKTTNSEKNNSKSTKAERKNSKAEEEISKATPAEADKSKTTNSEKNNSKSTKAEGKNSKAEEEISKDTPAEVDKSKTTNSEKNNSKSTKAEGKNSKGEEEISKDTPSEADSSDVQTMENGTSETAETEKNKTSQQEKNRGSSSSRRKPAKTHKVVEEEDDVSLVGGIEESMDVEEVLEVPAPKLDVDKDADSDGEAHTIKMDEEGNMTLEDGTVVVQPEPVDDKSQRAKQAQTQNAKKVQGDLEVLNCTACHRQMNPTIQGAVRRHPVLKVLICKRCYNWYTSDEIEQDSDGMDEQCRWCGEGGNLLCCDFCHNAFCKGCIKRNLGRKQLSKITDADDEEKWQCFACDLSPLDTLIKNANEYLGRIEERRKLAKTKQEAASDEKDKGKGKGGPFKSSKNQDNIDMDLVKSLIPASLLSKFTAKPYESSGPIKGVPSEGVTPDMLEFVIEKLHQSAKVQYDTVTALRGALKKLKNSNDSLKTKQKMCTQVNNIIHLQKKVYQDIDTFSSNIHSKKRKKSKKDTGSDEDVKPEKMMNGNASVKERKGIKIKLAFGKSWKNDDDDADITILDSDEEEPKPLKKEVNEAVSSKSNKDTAANKRKQAPEKSAKAEEVKEESAKDEADGASSDIAAILAACGTVNGDVDGNSEDMKEEEECGGMDHILAEVNALNQSLGSNVDADEDQAEDAMVNGDAMESNDDEDDVVEKIVGKRGRGRSQSSSKKESEAGSSRSRTSRPNRNDLEAQRQLHRELLEDSSDYDDDDYKDGDDSEDELSSSSDGSEIKSSGEEYCPAELREKRDEKMERRRQRLQEKRNRRRKKAKESKLKNKRNSDEEEESDDAKKKKKGKKGKKGKKDDSDDDDKKKKKKSKKGKESDDSEEDVKSKKQKDKKSEKQSKKSKKGKESDASEDEEDSKTAKKKSKASKKGKESDASEDEEDSKTAKKKSKTSKKDQEIDLSEDEEESKTAKKKSKKTEDSDEEEEKGAKSKTKASLKNKKSAKEEESEDSDKEKSSKKKKNEDSEEEVKASKKKKSSKSDSEEESKESKKSRKKGSSSQDDDEEEKPKKGVKKGENAKKTAKGKNSDDESGEDETKAETKKAKKESEEDKTKSRTRKSKKEEESDDDEEDIDKEIEELEKMPKLKKGKKEAEKADKEKDKSDKDKEKGGGKDKKKGADKKDVAGSRSKRLTAAEKEKQREEMLNDLNSSNSEAEVEDLVEDEEAKSDNDEMLALAKAKKKAEEQNDSDAEMKRKALLDDSSDDADEEDNSEEDLTPKKEKRITKKVDKGKGDSDMDVLEIPDSSEDESDTKKKALKKTKLLREKLSDSESDFEIAKPKKRKKSSDSDEEVKNSDSDSEPVVKKKRKRRKKTDSSDDFITDSDEELKPKAKKRKRVKKGSDESEAASGSDKDEEGSAKKGRKTIHKILKDKKLGDETKQALKEEEERRERMAERQKQYNQETVEDATSPMKCPVTTKLVLEKDADIEVDPRIINKLKPHQVEAVKFMWDNVAETVDRLKNTDGSGCILAHCMGLGKTLSVISIIHTLLMNKEKTGIKRVLCVTPLNTVLNWQNEFEKWVDEEDDLEVYELSQVKNNWSRADNLEMWHEGGGIMIVSYEMFRNLTQHRFTKNKKQKRIFTTSLTEPGPDLVVCDEGHILKNDASAISKAMMTIRTKRRIVLTGTPLQNNLLEYHCMVNFIKPNLLGSRKEFANMFVNPMANGQCADSTPYDVKVMKKRAHILHEKLDGCVQRKDYSALTKFLPPKQEYVIAVKLSKKQIEMYQAYLDHNAAENQSLGRGTRLFADYQALMRIWTHPWVMKLEEVRRENNRKFDSEEETEDETDNDSFIDDGSEDLASSTQSEESVQEISDDDSDKTKKEKAKKGAKGKDKEPKAGPSRRTRGRPGSTEGEVVKEWKTRSRGAGGSNSNSEVEIEPEKEETKAALSSEWWAKYVTEEDHFRVELSGKLVLLAEILRMAESIGDKVLVFSQSLLSLDLIEEFLDHWDKETKETKEDDLNQVAGNQGWCHGLDYFRFDGSTQVHIRNRWADIFNDPENIRARLFLISTKAGGLGINMVAANRVIIFDASWNPSHDVQSIFRVYRFGQTKPSYIYRFLAQGTMEEKIYSRQVTKQSLSQRVVDEHQIERHFTYADLKALYDFKPAGDEERETPQLPKDLLLAELLASHGKWIVNYHEHDSLLENKVAEDLTEEERKAAWEEFENEKKGIMSQANRMQQNYAMMGATPGGMNNYAATQNYMAQQMPGGAYLDLARAIYQQNPMLNVTEVYQRVHQYIQMQMANRQQQQLMVQQQMQQARMKALQEQQQRAAGQPNIMNLLSHIKSPKEPN